MKTENVIGFGISPSLNGYKPEQSRALFERAEAELAAIPGVRGVAAALVPLIAGSNWGNRRARSRARRRPSTTMRTRRFNEVGPGYFGKMGIPLIAGPRVHRGRQRWRGRRSRSSASSSSRRSSKAGIRSASRWRPTAAFDIEIVGVVKDSHYSAVKQDPPKLYYMPWRQDKRLNGLNFYVRSALPAGPDVPAGPARDAEHRPGPAAREPAHARPAGAAQYPERPRSCCNWRRRSRSWRRRWRCSGCTA